jgi:hypothetical protein
MLHYGPRGYHSLGRVFPRTFIRETYKKNRHIQLNVAAAAEQINATATLTSRSLITAAPNVAFDVTATLRAKSTVTAAGFKLDKLFANLTAKTTVTAVGNEKYNASNSLTARCVVTAAANCKRPAIAHITCKAAFLTAPKAHISTVATFTSSGNVLRHIAANLSGNCTVRGYRYTINFVAKTTLTASAQLTGTFLTSPMIAVVSLGGEPTLNVPYVCNTGYVCSRTNFRIKRCYQMVLVPAQKTKYTQKPGSAYLPAITYCTQNEIVT